MDDLDVAPVLLKMLGKEPAVAPFGLILAAQEATVSDYILRDGGPNKAATIIVAVMLAVGLSYLASLTKTG